MRYSIEKKAKGRSKEFRKDISLRINRAGCNSNGEPRFVVMIYFVGDACKKASNTNYVVPQLDDEFNRLYFTTSDEKKGYKLTYTNKINQTNKNIGFSVTDIEEWRRLEGDYDMKKDVIDNTYYIDLAFCPKP